MKTCWKKGKRVSDLCMKFGARLLAYRLNLGYRCSTDSTLSTGSFIFNSNSCWSCSTCGIPQALGHCQYATRMYPSCSFIIANIDYMISAPWSARVSSMRDCRSWMQGELNARTDPYPPGSIRFMYQPWVVSSLPPDWVSKNSTLPWRSSRKHGLLMFSFVFLITLRSRLQTVSTFSVHLT